MVWGTPEQQAARSRDQRWQRFERVRREREAEVAGIDRSVPGDLPPLVADAFGCAVAAWCRWDGDLECRWEASFDLIWQSMPGGEWSSPYVPGTTDGVVSSLDDRDRRAISTGVDRMNEVAAETAAVVAPAVRAFREAERLLLAAAPPDAFTPCARALEGLLAAVRNHPFSLEGVRQAYFCVRKAMAPLGDPSEATDGYEGWHLPTAVARMREQACRVAERQIGAGHGSTSYFRASPDYATVFWRGQTFTFSPAQRRVVRRLHESALNGTAGVSNIDLLDAAGSRAARVRDVFKPGPMHPAWGSLIVPVEGSADVYQLADF